MPSSEFALMLAAFLILAAAAHAETNCAPLTAATAAGDTLVYSRPDATSEIVTTLDRGARVCASEISGFGLRSVVLPGGSRGFVKDSDLDLATPEPTVHLTWAPLQPPPGGNPLHFTLGGYWTIPTDGPGPHVWEPTRQDMGFSLEISYELRNVFLALGYTSGGLMQNQIGFSLFSAKGGVIFGSGPIAPYLSAGIGYLGQDAMSIYDEDPMSGSGAAFVAEAGVLFLRDHSLGRLALVAQLIQPLFTLPNPDPEFASIAEEMAGTVILGVRVGL
jgi:hypothetical protein